MTVERRRDSLMATWGHRPPDAVRTARFLRRLDDLPGWRPLHVFPGRGSTPPTPMDLADDAVAELLQSRRDLDDFSELMPGTGCSFSVWNGLDGEEDLTCRLRVGETDGPLGNMVSIQVPTAPPSGTKDQADELLRVVVDVWRPDHAWSGPVALAFDQDADGLSAVGRLTYVPHEVALPLPASVTAEPFADGTLLRIDAEDRELSAVALGLRQVLVGAGLLTGSG